MDLITKIIILLCLLLVIRYYFKKDFATTTEKLEDLEMSKDIYDYQTSELNKERHIG